jgi:hypothetical protein
VAPKFVPVTVTLSATCATVGAADVTVGAGMTVNGNPLLGIVPFTDTTTLPDVAPTGTGTVMLVLLHAVDVAAVPLNVTVLVPCVARKFEPTIVTASEICTVDGVIDVRTGGTVNAAPALETPPTVTTAGPVVAPAGTFAAIWVAVQLVRLVAATPLKVTVLVPCEAPKFDPLIETGVPTLPTLGESDEMIGAGTVTVNDRPLLA